MPQEYEIYRVGPGDNTNTSYNQTMDQHNKPRESSTLRPGLCGDNPLATVILSQRSLSSQSLGKY